MYLIALPLLVYSGTQVSTKKTESHDITEIFSKLALNTITPNPPQYLWLFSITVIIPKNSKLNPN